MRPNPTRAAVVSVLLIIAVYCLIGTSASASDDVRKSLQIPPSGVNQILTLDDGSSLVGRITSIGEETIDFETDIGNMTIDIDKIKSIKEISETDIKEGEYWFPNPNRTRLYFAPTGRMLKAGEGYFADIYIFFPGFAYGVTDNFTIGGGMSIFPGVDFDKQLFYLNPKIGVDAGKSVDLAFSAMLIRVPNDDDDDEDFDLDDNMIVGILFASATIGTDDKSLTFGLGHGFVKDEMADKPAVLFGGEYRLSRRMSFVSENWVFPSVDNPLISYGLRFFGENLSVDLGLMNILGDDAIFPGFPYIGFVYNF